MYVFYAIYIHMYILYGIGDAFLGAWKQMAKINLPSHLFIKDVRTNVVTHICIRIHIYINTIVCWYDQI